MAASAESEKSKDMRTAVFKTREESKSLRTTIPAAFVQTLRIEEGDELDWDQEIRDGRIVLLVKVVKHKK